MYIYRVPVGRLLGTDCDTPYFRRAPASELSAYEVKDLELSELCSWRL